MSGFQPNLPWVKGVERSFQKFDIHPVPYLIYEMESKGSPTQRAAHGWESRRVFGQFSRLGQVSVTKLFSPRPTLTRTFGPP